MAGRQPQTIGPWEFLKCSRLNWMLVLTPASAAMQYLGVPQIWLFGVSVLALVPLAWLIGTATDDLANRVGPGLGGLLNATFGNSVELILSLFLLGQGLQEVVKASISGSIIGNVLLVFGLSMLAGGWGRQKQTFSQVQAGASAAMLFLAVVALVMPAVFDLVVFGELERIEPPVELLSLLVSGVLLITYGASLFFSLKTHRDLIRGGEETVDEPGLSTWMAIAVLLVATVFTAYEAELFSNSVSAANRVLGLTEFFIGVVIVAVVGNAAEHTSAVMMAVKDRMDLAVTISIGSSAQVALFVAPVLVFASLLLGHPLSLVFNAFEIMGIALAVIALAIVYLDGESNWFEGVQLVAVYIVLAIVFYFVPPQFRGHP